ncbi:hypothetical protein WN51_02233 [Melipona quadrifasciata]|uniref:Uncharacterized protein n=1 Tax=Melipona quadrifasciata TaxID=166423 RepID=A0A0M8ZW71_9HYME|nr:hypothetical protein WN51_02233 [Melipona quadrifasciata]
MSSLCELQQSDTSHHGSSTHKLSLRRRPQIGKKTAKFPGYFVPPSNRVPIRTNIEIQSNVPLRETQAASGCAPSVEVLPISDVAANKAECGNTAKMRAPTSLAADTYPSLRRRCKGGRRGSSGSCCNPGLHAVPCRGTLGGRKGKLAECAGPLDTLSLSPSNKPLEQERKCNLTGPVTYDLQWISFENWALEGTCPQTPIDPPPATYNEIGMLTFKKLIRADGVAVLPD